MAETRPESRQERPQPGLPGGYRAHDFAAPAMLLSARRPVSVRR